MRHLYQPQRPPLGLPHNSLDVLDPFWAVHRGQGWCQRCPVSTEPRLKPVRSCSNRVIWVGCYMIESSEYSEMYRISSSPCSCYSTALCISSYLISSHLILTQLISSHLVFLHLISSHLIPSHPIPFPSLSFQISSTHLCGEFVSQAHDELLHIGV